MCSTGDWVNGMSFCMTIFTYNPFFQVCASGGLISETGAFGNTMPPSNIQAGYRTVCEILLLNHFYIELTRRRIPKLVVITENLICVDY